jgi:hypothetical protein
MLDNRYFFVSQGIFFLLGRYDFGYGLSLGQINICAFLAISAPNAVLIPKGILPWLDWGVEINGRIENSVY